MAFAQLSTIIKNVIQHLPEMVTRSQLTMEHHYLNGENDKMIVKIELVTNSLKSNAHDASIIIHDFSYTINEKEHCFKMMIFARMCMVDNQLNSKAPARELEIISVSDKDGNPYTDYNTLAEIEKSFSSDVCLIWDSSVPRT